METKPFFWATLDAGDLARLPSRVLPSELNEPPGAYARHTGAEWILLRAPAGPMRSLIEKLNRLHGMFPQGLADSSRERFLDRALELLLAAEDGPQGDLAVENLELRGRYVKETPMLNSAQIHGLSESRSRNKSVPASRWRTEGKIFAVRMGGRDLYPAFQFEGGAPRPAVKRILDALPDDLSPWQIALWFSSANGWLDGGRPRDFLQDAEAVVSAASQLANPAIG